MKQDLKNRLPPLNENRNRFRHVCELPPNYNEPPKHSPYDTCWHRFGNNFRNFTLADRHNVQSKLYFRSMAELKREKDRHLDNPEYRFSIHPFSTYQIRKELFHSVLWIFLLISEAFMGSFGGVHFYKEYTVIAHIMFVLNLLLIFDVVGRFFVGFTIDSVRMVILEPKQIRRKYLCGHFVFDIIPILSFVFYYVFSEKIVGVKYLFYVYQFHYVRIVRLKTVYHSLDKFMANHKVNESGKMIFMCVLGVVLVLHLLACLMGMFNLYREIVNYEPEVTWIYQFYEERAQKTKQFVDVTGEYNMKSVVKLLDSIDLYFIHLSVVTTHFFGCGNDRFKIRSRLERVALSLILLTGMAFHIYVVARVLQIISMLQISEIKYEQMSYQFEQYMLRRDFPVDMKKRIRKYVDYKFNKKFFLEDQILDSLSEHLRLEVLLYSCGNLINQVKIFKGLSKSAMGCILALLQQEVYLKNDVIMNAADDDESIYFILYGTCSIVLPTGKELSHVEDGMHFGNTSNYSRSGIVHFLYSVSALEVTEVFRLRKVDVKYCMKAHPEIVYKLESLSEQKAKDYNGLFAAREREEQITDEILDQLRAKKILRRGLKRSEFYGR